MWLLFVPILILALMFAGGIWIVGAAWPLLLIALGAWMFWHEDGRHYRRHRAWVGEQRRPIGRPWQPSAAHKPVEETRRPKESRQQAELPIDLQVKVEQIRRKVDVLLGYADRFPPFSQDLYLVRQTASDYLPRTLNAFLSLSAQNVDKPLPGSGKTAREELRAQLDLLDSKLDEIAQDLQRQDADRLLANRRFLESRFGGRGEKSFTADVA